MGGRTSIGHAVSPFDELPFAEASDHLVVAKCNEFWRRPAVVDADVWRPGSARGRPGHPCLRADLLMGTMLTSASPAAGYRHDL